MSGFGEDLLAAALFGSFGALYLIEPREPSRRPVARVTFDEPVRLPPAPPAKLTKRQRRRRRGRGA